MAKLKRGLSVDNLLNKKYKLLPLSDAWHNAFSEPEANGVWFVWGDSGNGKSSFVLALCKELCRFGKGLYNSLEERDAHTMQAAFRREGMSSVSKKIILNWLTMAELDEYLSKPKSPWFVVIDSIQYARMRFDKFLDFKERHPNKLIIVMSQADGKLPKGRVANDIMFDASLKIWVEGFIAFSKGRYIGEVGQYVINEERAALYHGTLQAQAQAQA